MENGTEKYQHHGNWLDEKSNLTILPSVMQPHEKYDAFYLSHFIKISFSYPNVCCLSRMESLTQ